jgi:hypothetical protein
MVAEKRLYLIKKNLSLFVRILAALASADIIFAVVTFVLYGRARMKEQEQKEKFYLALHYASLFVLLLVGMVYMFFMVETSA